MEATVERQRTFEDFYRAERAKVLRSAVFTIDDWDLAAEFTDEAFARAFALVGGRPDGQPRGVGLSRGAVAGAGRGVGREPALMLAT